MNRMKEWHCFARDLLRNIEMQLASQIPMPKIGYGRDGEDLWKFEFGDKIVIPDGLEHATRPNSELKKVTEWMFRVDRACESGGWIDIADWKEFVVSWIIATAENAANSNACYCKIKSIPYFVCKIKPALPVKSTTLHILQKRTFYSNWLLRHTNRWQELTEIGEALKREEKGKSATQIISKLRKTNKTNLITV
jgi:hypothetical protein